LLRRIYHAFHTFTSRIKQMIRVQVANQAAKEFNDAQIAQLKNELDVVSIGNNIYSVIFQNKSYEISISKIDRDTKTISLTLDGVSTQVKCSDKMDLLLEKMGISTTTIQKLTVLKSPMPGLVIEWLIKEGEEVKTGDKLLILEAMKMENVIKSTGDGVIKKLHVNKGIAVEKNQVLIDFV
jgi:biotin carboxyl carrier protein